MPHFLSPIGNSQIVDANGDPLVGGTIETYLAGTSTPATTYTSITGGTAQGAVMTLNSLGLPTLGPVWMLGGVALKFIIKNALGVVQAPTYDNITGVGESDSALDQWVLFSGTPTYISATSFSVAGDQTNTFQVNRRVRTVNAGGTIYSRISVSSFGADITTVTVVNDSGVLDTDLSQVSYGLLSANNSSIPAASTTTTGGVELATTAETLAGTDAARAATPAGIAGSMRRVGQIVTTATGVVATGTTVTPADNTIPQITEGDQYMSLAITPLSATSTLEIEVIAFASNNAAATNLLTAALHQDAIANALAVSTKSALQSTLHDFKFTHQMTSGTTSATTFRVRIGGAVAATTTFNGVGGTQFFGGVIASRMIIREYLP